MAKTGAAIYLTAAELNALQDVGGYISSLIEQASEVPADLSSGYEGLHSVLDKAYAAQGQARTRNTMRKAVRIAERMLAADRVQAQ